MFYRPRYCCNCGEAVSRPRWTFTASRRFCELCETDFIVTEWASTVFVLAAIGAVVLSWTGYFNGTDDVRPDPRRAPVERRSSNLGKTNTGTDEPAAEKQPSKPIAETKKGKWSCGAETRKETMCTRRVSGKGQRCWQHR